MLKTLITALVLLCATSLHAEARHHHRTTGLHPHCNIWFPCAAPYASTPEEQRITRGRYIARQMGGFGGPNLKHVRHVKKRKVAHRHREVRLAGEILAHPIGCPARSFCACGAAVKVFGSPIRSLWLAANWYKFPRTSPASGMVAVRRHHVFVLEAHLGGKTWLAYDANSGKHLTRRHARSIRGYTIVNPHRTADVSRPALV